jgi:hypothetical protein
MFPYYPALLLIYALIPTAHLEISYQRTRASKGEERFVRCDYTLAKHTHDPLSATEYLSFSKYGGYCCIWGVDMHYHSTLLDDCESGHRS